MNRTKIAIIIFFALIVSSGDSWSNNEEWVNYTNTSTISILALEDNYLWQGSKGGAVRRDVNDPLNDTFYYNRGNGLAENSVRYITVDHLGRKWFGTAFSGVTVWDGVNSTSYDTLNSGLISNFTTCIADDKSGKVWIGTIYGLSVFDGVGWTNYDTSVLKDGVTALAIDDSGKAWIGTSINGVWLFDGVSWIIFNNSNVGLISNSVNTIIIQPLDTIWFGCAGGVSIFDGEYWKEWTSYDTSNSGLTSSGVSSIAIDSLGRKWFGGCCGGLNMFDGVNWITYDTTNSGLPSNQVVSMVVDSTGNLWIATETIERYSTYNLTKFDGSSWITYDISENQIASNKVRDIAIDRYGNKWIGTDDKGLCRFDGQNWITYNTENSGLPSNGTGTIAFDSHDNLWILSGGEVSKYDGVNWTNYLHPDTIQLECMAIDKNDVKWFGSMFNGLLRFDDTSWTSYDTSNSLLPWNWVTSLAVDSSNNLWVGTAGRYDLSGWVLKFDGTNWTVYNPYNSGLPWNAAIWTLAVDALDRIWIGTSWAGLTMYDGSSWFNYNISNCDIASNYVMDIGFDPSGNVWCATEPEIYYDPYGGYAVGGGVSKFDGLNWVTYNTRNSGLASDLVYAVAIDSKGNKWFGTSEDGVSFLGTTTDVEEEPEQCLPKKFALSQNYPNPFNPSTAIPFRVIGAQFMVHSPVRTTLVVYNILGQKVRTLLDEERLPGNYKIIWDGKDDTGKEVTSGIYFYQLKTGDYSDCRKMVLLR